MGPARVLDAWNHCAQSRFLSSNKCTKVECAVVSEYYVIHSMDLLIEAGILRVENTVLKQLELLVVFNMARNSDMWEFGDIYWE
jgi:hypothetical protein